MKKNEKKEDFLGALQAFVKERDIPMEDIIKEKQKGYYLQKVTARMILRKKTLLNWIDIIEAGEKEFKPIK